MRNFSNTSLRVIKPFPSFILMSAQYFREKNVYASAHRFVYKVTALLFLLCPISTYCQKEATQWRFGERAGIDFSSGSPVVVNTSQIGGWQGYASAADSAGNLLFYTDGIYVYNRNDVLMNGAPAGGGSQSSCQNALAVRKSGGQYYLFTTSIVNYYSVNYVVVDMTLAGGLGSVVTTPNPIPVSPTNIKMNSGIAGTRHCNGIDHWLIAHTGTSSTQSAGNNFHAYLVNSSGVSSSPIISTMGFQHRVYGGNCGYMKFSPNGKKLCVTVPFQGTELYDFDNATGVVSNRILLDVFPPTATFTFTNPTSWGAEFSPDGSKLYITYGNTLPFLAQFNLCAGTSSSDIVTSKTAITPNYIFTLSSLGIAPSIQLAPDGKIYVSEPLSTDSLAVIAVPNQVGASCGYSTHTIYLGVWASNFPCQSQYAFPNFESNYFEQKPVLNPITQTSSCGVTSFSAPTISLCATTGYSIQSYQWNFGDPTSGSLNSSTLSNPSHTYSQNGTYQVKAYAFFGCRKDSSVYTLTVSGLPTLSTKTTICNGDKNVVTVTGVTSYSLNGVAASSATMAVQPSVTTNYTLSAFDGTCITTRMFTVNVSPCNGIDWLEQERSIVLFPNPASNILFFVSQNEKESLKVFVKDLAGRTINKYNVEINGNQGAIAIDLVNGIYFVTIFNEGRPLDTKKIIVNR
jgi:PKD repeat protein